MRRLICLLVGLAVTLLVGLSVIEARFGAGLAPAPFLVAGYALGAAAFLIINALAGSCSMLRVAVTAGLVAGIAIVFGGAGRQFTAWVVLLPASGAIAASVPTSSLQFGQDTEPPDGPRPDRHARRRLSPTIRPPERVALIRACVRK